MAKNSVADWDATAANNTDVGGIDINEGCPSANINNAIREVMAQVKSGVAVTSSANSYTAIQKWAKGADVASATALTLGDDGNYFDITGTTAITSIATKGVGTRVLLQFDAALTLTHSAADLVLPGGLSITTAAGDHAEFVEYATGDWRCVNYVRAAATTLDVASATTTDIGVGGFSNIRIAGTTTITGLGTAPEGTLRFVRMAGALTLTHNGTSLILPGGVNITTAANDCFLARSLGSGNWLVMFYQRAAAVVTTYDSGDQTITAGGLLTLAHGLGTKPLSVALKLKCTTTEHNYAVGDEIDIAAGYTISATASRGASVYTASSDAATNLYVRYGSDANTFNVYNKTTGTIANITNSSWRLIVKAFA